jgi:ABC-type multidrug transport system ATPase subunit
MSGRPSCANSAPLVALQDATKHYRGRCVLRLRELELRQGDSMLIVGANGSGKSTLLRVLAGVTTLSSGCAHHYDAFDALEIGYVPQMGGLHPNLTVAENLRLAIQLRGRRSPDRLTQRWYVDGLDLAPLMNTCYRDLSGGFKRLAALSCALATEPRGLFVDEPLSGIDTAHARQVVDGLSATMSHLDVLVVTSHTPSDFPFVSRVVELKSGEME